MDIVVSLIAIGLHIQAAMHMGALWRDEVSVLALAVDSLPMNFMTIWSDPNPPATDIESSRKAKSHEERLTARGVPSHSRRMSKRLAFIEIALAVAVSLLAIVLHFRATSHMGGIWRDEATSIEIDSLPSIVDVVHNLKSDSFPILWHVALKSWLNLGLTSDADLRLFGFLIGVAVIVALWINARAFGFTSPLISLVLLEMNPTVIRWGDSIRGHGLGLLLLIGIPASVWFLLKQPTWQRFLLALFFCLLAVQSEYYSAVLLLAAGGAAMIVGCICRQIRGVISVGAVGLLCALSLVPYMMILGGTDDTNKLHQAEPGELTILWYLGHIYESFGYLWRWVDMIIWVTLLGLAVAAAFCACFAPRKEVTKESPALKLDKYRGIYFLISLAVAFVGYYCFLVALKWATNNWYYIPLIGFCTITLEGALNSVRGDRVTIDRIVVAPILVALWLPWAWNDLRVRLTDVDLIAQILNTDTQPGDIVVINPWNSYISFQRYYKGLGRWSTVPVMTKFHFSDLDELRQIMAAKDQGAAIVPLAREATAALRRGNRVWVLGYFDLPDAGHLPTMLPPAPNGPRGWKENPYYLSWSEIFCYFLKQHADSGLQINVPSPDPISRHENMGLYCLKGWHEVAPPASASAPATNHAHK